MSASESAGYWACENLAEEVMAFISQSQLLRALPESLRLRLARKARIGYLPTGQSAQSLRDHLVLVRSGHWRRKATADNSSSIMDLADAHHCFAVDSAMDAEQWQVSEDSLVYLWQRGALVELELEHLMQQAGSTVATDNNDVVKSTDPLMVQRVSQLLQRSPITVTGEQTIGNACQLMMQHRVSCLLVVNVSAESADDKQQLIGIVTDRDLRNRVLAAGGSADMLVNSVMTESPVTCKPESLLVEALLQMSALGIHHLPVVDHRQRLCGVITSSDLLQQQYCSPLALVSAIRRQHTVEGLAKISTRFAELLRQFQASGTDADVITRLLTQLSDSVTRQLVDIAQATFGEAPCDWAWLAFGSQGRYEQGACSDQDNGLLIDESASAEDFAWFRRFAEFICDGLDACGYVRCPGKIMACETRWLLRQSQWLQQFKHWVEQPTPESLMLASIFFDWRAVCGESSLAKPLRSYLQQAVTQNSLFLAHLAANALQHTPPLGVLGRLLLERDGEAQKVLDLKMRGLVPIIDLARIYALASGISDVDTVSRLAHIDARWLSEDDQKQLLQAWKLIAGLRLAHHVECLTGKQPANNRIAPDAMTPLQRQQLKQAFAVVSRAQEALRLKLAR